MYYTYMLRCEDNSIYTGMTSELERRIHEHFSGENNCAKYTNWHKPIKFEIAWESSTRSLASKLEFHIKKNLTKSQKEELIKDPQKLENLLKDKMDISEYRIVKKLKKLE